MKIQVDRQLVSAPTHGDGILDVIITDKADLYETPEILEPVPCDDEEKTNQVTIPRPWQSHLLLLRQD